MILNPNVISVYAGTPVEEINAIPGLLQELQAMSRDCQIPIYSEDREVYLGTNKPRVKEIGERLNSSGGYNLMLWAASTNSSTRSEGIRMCLAWDRAVGIMKESDYPCFKSLTL